MKKTTIACLIALTALSGFAQNARVSGSMYINPARAKDKPLGSPYMQNAFANAKIAQLKIDAFMRYNVYKDEFEYISPKNDTLILDKIEDFSSIHFEGLRKKYDLTQYTDNKKLVYGYLMNRYEKDGYILYKKENIGLTEAKVAKTSFESSMPARYNKLDDAFFLKNKEAGTTEFPDSKKALAKLFPDKKAAIETFLKDNKINFEEENDLIKVINFLATP